MRQLESDYKKNLTKFQGDEREVGKPRESFVQIKLSKMKFLFYSIVSFFKLIIQYL